MQIPQIRLESTQGRIGLTTIQPKMEQEQPKADLSIEQPQAELSIETIPAKMTIDTTEARADVDLKSIARRKAEAAQQGYQDLLSGIARRSDEGEQLMRIENGGNPVVEQAQANSASPVYDFNIGFVPSAGSVKIDFQPAQVKIDVVPRKPIINVKQNKPVLNYEPGKIEVHLDQRPELKVDFVTVDIKV
ncbi:DUF6470 family protein [Metabacillus sp. GX 13764]|uniref:DUF6470 family protein n=1 Tax=Metabacillus kandeliae TaxID=2900151 RepID=UPI001E46F75F|nr:DUF6470 family protein [Metabacillus kandeliae]MCD7034447.1 DUF6470 family protein [Metabacillus kandeliae]